MSPSPQQRTESTNVILFSILLIILIFMLHSCVNSDSLNRRIQETNRQLYRIELKLHHDVMKQETNNENR